MKTTMILGGPGTGKTYRLMEVMEKELKSVQSSQIAFVSFTRGAVNEARDRAMKLFDLTERQLPFFRTLHSMCYRQMGMRPDIVMKRRDYRKVGNALGITLSGYKSNDGIDGVSVGDRMLFFVDLARATGRNLKDIWCESSDDEVSWPRLEQFVATLHRYKEQNGLNDFTDMLDTFSKEGGFVGVKVAIIDEAQDLTPLQWKVVDIAFEGCERIYIAGDDDQAIYGWSGADVERMLTMKCDNTEVRPVSRRIPTEVFKVAKRITDQVSRRHKKEWKPREAKGSVEYIGQPSDVDLREGTWYLLARNRCFLSTLEDECIRQGVPYTLNGKSSIDKDDIVAIRCYEKLRGGEQLTHSEAVLVADRLGVDAPEKGVGVSYYGLEDLVSSKSIPKIWHDAFHGVAPSRIAYYLTILRSGQKMTRPPQVRIDTIHGVKGGEADNVLLMTDQTARTEAGTVRRPDDEARVFYVGVTRAKENLFIMNPTTNRSYRI